MLSLLLQWQCLFAARILGRCRAAVALTCAAATGRAWPLQQGTAWENLGELIHTVRETWRGLGSALSCRPCQRPAELSLGCGVWEQQAACFLLGPANGGAAVSLKAFGVGISLGSQPWEQRVLPGTRVLSLG